MHRHTVLLVLMLLLNQDIVTSHILTSTKELHLDTCIRVMILTVSDVCAIYGHSEDQFFDTSLELPELERLNNESIKRSVQLMMRCCLGPCTLTELVSIC